VVQLRCAPLSGPSDQGSLVAWASPGTSLSAVQPVGVTGESIGGAVVRHEEAGMPESEGSEG
jgi:hypothetical protein